MTSARSCASALRLAVFTDTALPQLNGVSHTIDRLAQAVRARGGAVRLFTTADPAAPADERDVVRYPSRELWLYPQLRMAWPSPAAAAAELRAWGATLVHAATPFGLGFAARQAARAAGVPFVSSYHTGLNTYARYVRLERLSAVGWSYLRWFHNGGLRTYCPTRAVERELVARGLRGTAIWGRGVDARRFAPAWRSPELRARLGAGDGRLLAVYVGRLAAEKELEVAFRAMHRLRAMAPDRFAFAVAGDGPHERQCRQRAPAGTTFVGRLQGDELSAFYASADVFVFPSTNETFGNVLLEAMASGLAVVAADSPPSREVVGRAGVLVPPRDDAALAATLLALADDPARRARLAAAAREAVRDRTWERVFDGLVGDYLSLLAERPAPHPIVAPGARRSRRAARAARAAARVLRPHP